MYFLTQSPHTGFSIVSSLGGVFKISVGHSAGQPHGPKRNTPRHIE